MRPCAVESCGQPSHDDTAFCQAHWRQLNDRVQDRCFWTLVDWRACQTAATAKAYHKAVALAVAELTASMQANVEAGRVS